MKTALHITATAIILVACGRTTPVDKALAEAIEADKVDWFITPDLAFFDVHEHVKQYCLYTTYDIKISPDGTYELAENAQIYADDRPRTTKFTAEFNTMGSAIGDNLESIACDMAVSWKDLRGPGVHTVGKYTVMRDSNEYVIAEICPEKELHYSWQDGRLIQTVWLSPKKGDTVSIKEYIYGKDGFVHKVRERYPSDRTEDTTVYTDYQTDSSGNWTLRIGSNDERDAIFAEIRAIDYF